jgi:hypothetical protein
MDFKKKFLKYKNKYIELKNSLNYSKLQNGGLSDKDVLFYSEVVPLGIDIPYTFIKNNTSINAKIYTDLYNSISNLTDNELNNGPSLTKNFCEFTAKNLTTYTYRYTLSNKMLTTILMTGKQSPNSIAPDQNDIVTIRNNVKELINAIESAFTKTTNVDATKQIDITNSKNTDVDGPSYPSYGKENFYFSKIIPYTFIKENKDINAKIYTDLYNSISDLKDNELNNGPSLTKTFYEFTAKNLTTYTYRYTLSKKMLTTICMIFKQSPNSSIVPSELEDNMITNQNNIKELFNAIESAFAKTTNVDATKQQ